MKFGVLMEIKGIEKDRYDTVTKELDLDSSKPESWPRGLIFHMAGPTPAGWRIVDAWESMTEFEHFFDNRLSPAIKKHSVVPDKIEYFDIHNLYANKKIS